jgi:steroid 5-alpha reductase family enzyme
MDASLTMTLAISCLAFTGIWLINVMTEDAGVIDYYWGPGFSVIALVHVSYHGVSSPYQWVLLAVVLIWSVRLAGHLIRRHHGAVHEDGRYRAMRKSGGPSWWWASLFKVFLLQAVLLWLIAAPLHVAFRPGGADTVSAALFWTGMAVFALGFVIEWIADVQLANGKQAQGSILPETGMVTHGLWSMSRHPNYVGEIILWWGLGISALAMSGSLIALAGPALLTAVIAGVSLPLTEQHMMRTRPGYDAYMQRVPALVGVPGRTRSRQNQPAE